MNFGKILILSSLMISIASLVFYLRKKPGDTKNIKLAGYLYVVSSIMISSAMLMLFAAFVTNDFSYSYVYNHSDRTLNLAYLFSAAWAGQEGSFLLWLLIMNIFGLFVIRSGDSSENIVVSIILVTQIFILSVLIPNSPFTRLWEIYPGQIKPGQTPGDGVGLNPLLADPWMVVHPPVLFLGYASSVIPLGYAIAGLLNNDFSSWIERSYKWLIFSFTTLGIGIFLGGYWAYKVLGWGGYWGWDPVENSSLVPWLVALALLHGIVIQRKKGALVKTNIALAIIYFILVFYSAFLTRSGILSSFSVHSFGESTLAKFFVPFLLLAITGSAYIFIKKYNDLKSEKLETKTFTWELLTVFGIITILIYAAIILIGTSMPIISGAFMDNPSNVTSSFYNSISVPLGSIIIILMAYASFMKTSGKKKVIITAAIASVILGFASNYNFTSNISAYLISIISIFAVILFAFDIASVRSKNILPSRLCHIGIGIIALGIIYSGYHSTSTKKKITAGVEQQAGPVKITLNGYKGRGNGSLSFLLNIDNHKENISTTYYAHQKFGLYREPYISHGIIDDIYIIPEDFISGLDSVTTAVLKKGEEGTIDKFKVKFEGIRQKGLMKGMNDGDPEIFAILSINGIKIETGFKMIMGQWMIIAPQIPGTDRIVSLVDISNIENYMHNGFLRLHIPAGKDTKIPPDTVLVDVTSKRLIWLVWLGAAAISAGGLAAFIIQRRKKGN